MHVLHMLVPVKRAAQVRCIVVHQQKGWESISDHTGTIWDTGFSQNHVYCS